MYLFDQSKSIHCSTYISVRYLPIGVLFDLNATQYDLPWSITVHFQGYPAELIRCPNEAVVKAHFVNLLKEVIIYQSQLVIMIMFILVSIATL